MDGSSANMNDTEDNDDFQIKKDMYTLLLVLTSYITPYFWFALFICFQQFGLLVAILTQQFESCEQRTLWNVPFSNSVSVQFGQFTAITFALPLIASNYTNLYLSSTKKMIGKGSYHRK